jgi:DNA-binding NarL/FixJ family response regulator
VKSRSKELRELQKQWYQKLEDDGFVDVEKRRRSSNVYTSDVKNGHHEVTREAKQRYYELLAHAYNTEQAFVSEDHRLIMKLASQGYSPGEIALAVPRDRKTIRIIIRRYENKWGVRQWTRKQMYMPPIK